MTATNMCSNFGGFRLSPPDLGALLKGGCGLHGYYYILFLYFFEPVIPIWLVCFYILCSCNLQGVCYDRDNVSQQNLVPCTYLEYIITNRRKEHSSLSPW